MRPFMLELWPGGAALHATREQVLERPLYKYGDVEIFETAKF
jgi:hypothetical protein